MAYLVIARKWRPQTFDEVIGQPHVVLTLKNAIESNRIAHAYLFAGARGVGKTSVARILAKAINCVERTTSNPCNRCATCTSITNGSSLDVLEIDGASNRGIDEIRELRESARYLPASCKYKVYIIDEVHMLTGPAFNALLKTLEEPPTHVVFIFATTAPQKIPVTILSRCQRFDFRRISVKEITGQLKRIVSEEDMGLSEAVLSIIAREADGSMRDAQSLLEQIMTFVSGGTADEAVLELLGIVDQSVVQRAANAILDGDVLCCIEVVNDVYERGYNVERFCQELANYFRNMLVLKIAGKDGKKLIDMPESIIDRLEASVDKVSTENLHYYTFFLMKGIEDLRFASLPKLTLEMLLVQLCKIPTLSSIPVILDKVKEIESRLLSHTQTLDPQKHVMREGKALSALSSEQLQEPLPKTSKQADDDSLDLPRTWEGFIRFLRANKKAMLATQMEMAELLAFGEGEIRIRLAASSVSLDSDRKDLLQNLANEFFGSPIRVIIVDGKDEKRDGGSVEIDKKKIIREAKAHRAVNLILDVLGGEVVDVKVDKSGDEALSLEENELE